MPSAGPGGKGGAARGTQWLLRPAWPCCLPAATAAPWERRCSRGRRRGEADGTLAAVLRLRCKSQIIPDGNFVCKHGANTNKQTPDRTKGSTVQGCGLREGRVGGMCPGAGRPYRRSRGGRRGNQRPRKSASPDPMPVTHQRQSWLPDLGWLGAGGGGGDPGRSLRRGRPCRPRGTGRSTAGRRGTEPGLAGQQRS